MRRFRFFVLRCRNNLSAFALLGGEVAGSELGSEIGGGAGVVFEDGVVDFIAANGVRVGGAAVPEVFQVQDGEVGELVALTVAICSGRMAAG